MGLNLWVVIISISGVHGPGGWDSCYPFMLEVPYPLEYTHSAYTLYGGLDLQPLYAYMYQKYVLMHSGLYIGTYVLGFQSRQTS